MSALEAPIPRRNPSIVQPVYHNNFFIKTNLTTAIVVLVIATLFWIHSKWKSSQSEITSLQGKIKPKQLQKPQAPARPPQGKRRVIPPTSEQPHEIHRMPEDLRAGLEVLIAFASSNPDDEEISNQEALAHVLLHDLPSDDDGCPEAFEALMVFLSRITPETSKEKIAKYYRSLTSEEADIVANRLIPYILRQEAPPAREEGGNVYMPDALKENLQILIAEAQTEEGFDRTPKDALIYVLQYIITHGTRASILNQLISFVARLNEEGEEVVRERYERCTLEHAQAAATQLMPYILHAVDQPAPAADGEEFPLQAVFARDARAQRQREEEEQQSILEATYASFKSAKEEQDRRNRQLSESDDGGGGGGGGGGGAGAPPPQRPQERTTLSREEMRKRRLEKLDSKHKKQ